jgi:hypothetical protein
MTKRKCLLQLTCIIFSLVLLWMYVLCKLIRFESHALLFDLANSMCIRSISRLTFKNILHDQYQYRSWTTSFDIQHRSKRIHSLCSERATQRGLNQKIISISAFGPVENFKMFSFNLSFVFLEALINDIRHVYADQWILRIYHDRRVFNQMSIAHYETRYTFVDFCNITNLNLNYIPAKIWRFLPASDETVRLMISRDLDSPLIDRERAAIDEWLLSNWTFHSMRDHPFHAVGKQNS